MQAVLLFGFIFSVVCVLTQSSVPTEPSIASSATSSAKRPTQDPASPSQYSVASKVQNTADAIFSFQS